MQVVNLVSGDRRSPEEGQSYVREDAVLGCASCPVFALHDAIIRSRTTERDSISVVVGAHARERAAPGNSSFEMVDVRRLQVASGGLIVAAILVQPGNRIGPGAPFAVLGVSWDCCPKLLCIPKAVLPQARDFRSFLRLQTSREL